MVRRRSRTLRVTALGTLALALLAAAVAWLLTGERSPSDAKRDGIVLTRAEADAASPAPGLRAGDEHALDVQAPAQLDADADAAAAPAQATGVAAAALPGNDVLFTGRVVDEHGAPVAEALVSHVPSYKLRGKLGLLADTVTHELALERLSHTSTAADGSFSLRSRDGLAAARAQPSTRNGFSVFDGIQPELLVQHPDFAVLAHVCLDFKDSPHDTGSIVLSTGAVLTGRTLSEEGEPLAGARIGPSRFSGRMEDTRVGNWTLARQAMFGTSGADGRFRVTGLVAGEIDIDIAHPDGIPVTVQPLLETGAVTDLGEVKLVRGDSIRGLVLGADGKPVAGASVLARASSMTMGRRGDDSAMMEFRTIVHSTGEHEVRVKTAADGTFVAGTLNQSHYSVFADAPVHELACVRDVTAGTSDLLFTLQAQATLLLSIVDAQSRAPVAEAHGEAYRRSGNQKATDVGFDPSLEVLEGPAGSLLVQRAGPVRTDITVSAPGYATRGFVLPGVQPGQQLALELELTREAVVSGRALDEQQQPVVRAEVTLSPPKDGPVKLANRKATTDDAGTFRFEGLSSGEWSLVARAAGFVDSAGQPLAVAAESTREDIDVVLARAAVVRGLVLGVEGEPVASQPVHVRHDDPAHAERWWNLRADKDGRFVFDRLPAGAVTVTAWPGGEAQLVLTAGAEADVTLRLRRLPVAYGRVTAAGSPVVGASVEVFERAGHGFSSGDTSANVSASGDYEVTLQATGTFVLAARAPSTQAGVSDDGCWSRPVSLTVDWGQRVLVDLRFGGGRLSGLVVDSESGEPIRDAWVQVHDRALDADASWKTETDARSQTGADGRYGFERLHAGDYDISAVANGYASAQAQSVAVIEGAAVEAPRLALSSSVVLKGTVRTASGKPLPSNLRVTVHPVEGATGDITTSVKSDGSWSVGVALVPGPCEIRLFEKAPTFFSTSDASSALATAQVTLSAGQTHEVDLLIAD